MILENIERDTVIVQKELVPNTAGYILEDGNLVILKEYHGEESDYKNKQLVEFSNTHAEEDTCIRVYKKPTYQQYDKMEEIFQYYLDNEGYCKVEIWNNGTYDFYEIYSTHEGACGDDTGWKEHVGNWSGYDLVKVVKNYYAKHSTDLEEAKKKKKKKYNALGWFQTFNPDAGNVEYNNAFFNHVMGNTSSSEFGEAAASADSGCMGESLNKSEEDKDLNTDKKELFARMCRENHFLQMLTIDDFEEVMNSFLKTNDVAALVNDIKYDGSVSLSNDEIEAVVRTYFTDSEEVADVQYGVHDFNQQSIVFRGTEEECAEFIDNNGLWDDAEIYTMTPDDPHYLKEESEEKQICSICGDEFEGWGNNAWPINDGKCCDSCNYLFVLPERIKNLQKRKETPDVREAFDELNKLDD